MRPRKTPGITRRTNRWPRSSAFARELAAGDHRALYLAWLAGYGTWERDESDFDDEDEDTDELEPPVPAGLRTLSAPQRALADFLRLDDDLLAVAAEASPPRDETVDDPVRLAAWVTKLPVAEKDRLLVRVATEHAGTVHMELLRRFRDDTVPTAEYDNAITLLTDLRALSAREDRPHEFDQRCAALRQAHARKPALIDRLNRAKL